MKRLKLLAITAPLVAAGLTLAAPGVNGSQEAQAYQWQYYISNTGAYCEGCCGVNSLCCSIGFPCSVKAPAESPGG